MLALASAIIFFKLFTQQVKSNAEKQTSLGAFVVCERSRKMVFPCFDEAFGEENAAVDVFELWWRGESTDHLNFMGERDFLFSVLSCFSVFSTRRSFSFFAWMLGRVANGELDWEEVVDDGNEDSVDEGGWAIAFNCGAIDRSATETVVIFVLPRGEMEFPRELLPALFPWVAFCSTDGWAPLTDFEACSTTNRCEGWYKQHCRLQPVSSLVERSKDLERACPFTPSPTASPTLASATQVIFSTQSLQSIQWSNTTAASGAAYLFLN